MTPEISSQMNELRLFSNWTFKFLKWKKFLLLFEKKNSSKTNRDSLKFGPSSQSLSEVGGCHEKSPNVKSPIDICTIVESPEPPRGHKN